MAVAKNDREKYHFATLLQLETETKARLRPLLYKYGISLQEEIELAHIDDIVQGYIANDWPDFCKANKTIVSEYLACFNAILLAALDEDKPILENMIVHESSIYRWFDMESKGEHQGSLDAIITQLNYPIPS
ncbi:hypothetical protein [Thalassotalea sp. Y01]|uniref:hypothetical protein n=1 Tax=Thalassotalea sp. Y01 TaxID=2729613 RepID=UPI00145C71B5|nr:hypothetical protein [Thalassotalea sp. Y01]NMP15452.1 hypothetical protein [Thalassotalea sp. Y01]